jgi:hypothetical protein
MRLIVLAILGSSALACLGQQVAPTLPEAPQPVTPQPIVQRDARWRAVERLGPSDSIEVRDRATGVTTACLVDYVTDAVLACGVADSYGPLRHMVYPHAGIDRVWLTRLVSQPNWKLVGIFAGIGAAAGSLLFSPEGGPLMGLAALGFGSLGAGSVLKLDTHPVTRRKLVYVAL